MQPYPRPPSIRNGGLPQLPRHHRRERRFAGGGRLQREPRQDGPPSQAVLAVLIPLRHHWRRWRQRIDRRTPQRVVDGALSRPGRCRETHPWRVETRFVTLAGLVSSSIRRGFRGVNREGNDDLPAGLAGDSKEGSQYPSELLKSAARQD